MRDFFFIKMKLKLTLLFLLFSLKAFTQQLSETAQVALITVGPGNELYSSFGHSALVIEDTARGISEMYNYGTFDFTTENFYIKFLRGQLPYQISKNKPEQAYNYWTYENRLVTKQVLNLSKIQKQKVYDFLENNYLPENRTYQYKFFYDNCSTRIRDVIANAAKDSLIFDTSLNDDKSFREWIDQYAGYKKWADFGMDIAIGFPSDSLTGYWGAMFIPDNMMFAFDKAKIKHQGIEKPLVTQKYDINKFYIHQPEKKSETVTPLLISALILLLSIATSFFIKNKKLRKGFDYIFYGLLGLSGIILFLLWFFTDHGVTQWNFNILWAFPLIVPFFFIPKTQKPLLYSYTAVLFLFILIQLFHYQSFTLPSYILVLAILIRNYSLLKPQNELRTIE